MKRTIFIVLVIIVVIWISTLFSDAFENNIDIKPTDQSNVILVSTPIKNSEVDSPLKVAGRARSDWFYEGTFPIFVYDSYDNLIAESHVSAQGDLVNDEFVKFVGDVQFSNYIKGANGTLVLRKNFAPGATVYDEHISIPVIFK
jgi:hypothetical protein